MKLLLHIGTHKTASTSLQHFFTLNRTLLQRNGFLYPQNNDSAYVSNFLAARLAHGKEREVSAYLAKAGEEAKKKNCHTVIISAESFYAMTGFFIDMQGRSRPSPDYYDNEFTLINKMKQHCAGYEDISVICYLRPQDDFASSLYNQFVKNTLGISDDYESFVQKNANLFDYDRHLALWEQIFGKSNMTVLAFETHKRQIIKDFCNRFLGSGIYEQAREQDFEANIRLCRDVLEVKRLYNKIPKNRTTAFFVARGFHRMARDFPDTPGYQTFASLDFRNRFFQQFQEGNNLLAARYGLGHLVTITDTDEPSYPGLSPGKEEEIRARIRTYLESPLVKAGIFMRRSAARITPILPFGGHILSGARSINNQLRLKIFKW